MNDSQGPKSIRPQGGVFNDLTQYAKLVLRLMGDRRVNPLVKLLPIGSLAYLLIPDLVLGPVDDAVVVRFQGAASDPQPLGDLGIV